MAFDLFIHDDDQVQMSCWKRIEYTGLRGQMIFVPVNIGIDTVYEQTVIISKEIFV